MVQRALLAADVIGPKPRAEVWRPFPAEPTMARPCARCGIPLAFGAGKVPPDLTTLRAIYPSAIPPVGSPDRQPIGWEARCHFETCPNAREFSGKGKR